MRPVVLSAGSLALLLPLVSGCRPGAPTTGGRVEVSWTGTHADSDTARIAGRFAAPSRAAWCPVAARLEVTAVREDQGFGLAVYPESVLAPGSYPAFDAGLDSITHRPGSAGALRWFTERRLEAFQADSGSVELTAAGEATELRFSLRMVSLDQPETLVVTGRATGLVPGPCPADSTPPTVPVTDAVPPPAPRD